MGPFAEMEPTWPAASVREVGPFRLREGRGAGLRVGCATCDDASALTDTALAELEAEARALGQVPLVRIEPGQEALDRWLGERGYRAETTVCQMTGRAEDIAAELPPITAFAHWPPLAIQRALWEEAGISPARREVMARVAVPKAALLGRAADRAAGTAFVACAGETTFLHALYVAPALRRSGMGRAVMQAAASWAQAQGSTYLSLAVSAENEPALRLYQALGMAEVARSHYRVGA